MIAPHRNQHLRVMLARAMAGLNVDISGVDDGLYRAARYHGATALLARRIHEGTVSGATPLQIDRVRQYARQAAAWNLLAEHDTGRLLDLLDRRGHAFLLLKGFAVAHLAYPAPWLRPCSDIDIFVDEADRLAIARCLDREGYGVVNLEANPLSTHQFQVYREDSQGRRTWFDMHYRISNRAVFRDCLRFDDVLPNGQTVPLQDRNARTLSTTDLLLHACLHRVAHGRGRNRDRLVWLYDAHLLFSALDEQAITGFVDRAREHRIGGVCADALHGSRELFGTGLSDDTLETLRADSDQEPSARLLDAGRFGWMLADLRGETGFGGKWSLLGEWLANRLGRRHTA